MKSFFGLMLVAAVAGTATTRPGVRPDSWEFDGTTESSYYQACTTATNTFEGGTACVVYNPQSGNIHWSITHSVNPYDVMSVALAQNPAGAAVTYSSDYWMPDVHFRPGTRVRPVPAVPAATYVDLFQLPITGGSAGTLSAATTAAAGGGNAIDSNTFAITLTLNYRLTSQLVFTFTRANLVDTLSGVETRKTAQSNKNSFRFAPGFVETFTPRGSNVLLTRKPYDQNRAVVVAVGPTVTGVSEGQTVIVSLRACLSQKVQLNGGNLQATDNTLSQSPYCWVASTDILGVLSETSYGANRAYAGTAHIKKAVGTSYSWDRLNSFQGGFY